jgi:hypothetical protein
MKKLYEQVLSSARAKPVRFLSVVLALVVVGAVGLTL